MQFLFETKTNRKKVTLSLYLKNELNSYKIKTKCEKLFV